MSDDTTTESTEGTMPSASRRGVLKTVGAIGAAVTVSGAALAQMNGDGTGIELGGVTSGWEGRAPSSIEGQTNPTLELQAGTTYQLTWENVDGAPHNVVINDADGQQLERTEIINEQGATQTLEFTATPEMSEYLCEVHPATMVGDVSVSDTATTNTTTDTDGADADEPGGDEGNQSEPANESDAGGGPEGWKANTSAAPSGPNISDPGTPSNYNGSDENVSNVGGPQPGVFEGWPDDGNRTENESEPPMPDGNESDDGGNGKAKSGNGKAKSGNGNKIE